MKNLFYIFNVSFLKYQLANKLFAFLTLLFLLLPQYACNTTEPPSNQTLLLKLEDVSCIEAWIQFSSTNIQTPNNITLYINDQPKKTINLTTTDTLLYIDSLLPNQTYKIRAAMQPYNNASNELSVRTMDTTSHNFTWQTWTFGGQAGSCALYDVAIIDENNIWAVGEIYMLDSLGRPDPNAYNAVHWNGQSWELKRIYTYSSCNAVDYAPLKAIWAFSANNIAVTSGGSIGWFDGNTNRVDCGIRSILTGSINKLWGSSSSDLYAVGSNGNIAHYQNGKWTKIESGTTTDILDIYGFTDAVTFETSVYCAVSYVFQNGDRKILRIKNNKVDSLSWFSDKRVNSIWTPNNSIFYSAGDGVYEYKNSSWNQVMGLPPYYSDNIRGNDLNDIFICGDFGLLSHFNGSSWFTYNEHYMRGILFSVVTKNSTVITVGLRGSNAIIIKGTRN